MAEREKSAWKDEEMDREERGNGRDFERPRRQDYNKEGSAEVEHVRGGYRDDYRVRGRDRKWSQERDPQVHEESNTGHVDERLHNDQRPHFAYNYQAVREIREPYDGSDERGRGARDERVAVSTAVTSHRAERSGEERQAMRKQRFQREDRGFARRSESGGPGRNKRSRSDTYRQDTMSFDLGRLLPMQAAWSERVVAEPEGCMVKRTRRGDVPLGEELRGQKRVMVAMNLFSITFAPKSRIFQYDVRFKPASDKRALNRKYVVEREREREREREGGREGEIDR